jgi:hypothetical protein
MMGGCGSKQGSLAGFCEQAINTMLEISLPAEKLLGF